MKKWRQKIVDWIHAVDQKIIIGISGHGAAGKTTFVNDLKRETQPTISVLNTDPYIIGSKLRKHAQIEYEYGGRLHRSKMTACHPSAHFVEGLERDVRMIRDGLNFYTIETNYRKSELFQSNNEIIIVEGMTVAFMDPALFDLTIYFYTDDDTEFKRRRVRDLTERGGDLTSLEQSHEQRRIQYWTFMHERRRHFDLIVQNSAEQEIVEKLNFPQL